MDIRDVSKMSQFTFYLDDMTKLNALKKLQSLGLDTKKGAMAATIRTLMNMFAEGKLDNLPDLAERIEAEYLFTTKKNKRSSL